MADNTTLNPGSGGDTIRTDDVGGIKVPVSKIMLGGDGLDLGFVSGSNPFPTQTQSGSISAVMVNGLIVTPSNPLPVNGTVNVGGSVSVAGSVTTQSGSVTGLLAGGLAVSAANPVPAQLYSGSQTGILMGANPVAQSNPLPTRPMSGSQTGILMGANPVDLSNPLAVRAMSGSQTGILMGANPVADSNPLAVKPVSGSQTGILVGANPVASTNPLPVTTMTGSAVSILVANPGAGFGVASAVAPTNPLPVSQTSGSQTGILVGANPVANSNPLPISDAGGALTVDGAATLTLPGNTTTNTALLAYQNAEPAAMVISGSTVMPVYHAFGDPTTSGSANQIIAPQGAGKRIAVLSVELMCLVATNVRFVSTGSAGTITNISNKMYLPANGGAVLPHNPHAWFKTAANEGLNLDLSAGNAVGVTLTWTIFNN